MLYRFVSHPLYALFVVQTCLDILSRMTETIKSSSYKFSSRTINLSKSTSWVYFLSNVDVYTEDHNEAIICYGDSITSQDWPDYFLLALREAGIKNRSVIRKAVSGTRILREYSCITYQSYGKNGFHRFEHEVSSVSGAKTIIVQHGINDIIHPVGAELNPFRPMSDLPTAKELISGLQFYEQCAFKLGLDLYFGTLLPIYGWRTYQPFRENLKNEVNHWIRERKNVDFEAELASYRDYHYEFKQGYDSGDHLHPSKEAYQRMGKLMAHGNRNICDIHLSVIVCLHRKRKIVPHNILLTVKP